MARKGYKRGFKRYPGELVSTTIHIDRDLHTYYLGKAEGDDRTMSFIVRKALRRQYEAETGKKKRVA